MKVAAENDHEKAVVLRGNCAVGWKGSGGYDEEFGGRQLGLAIARR